MLSWRLAAGLSFLVLITACGSGSGDGSGTGSSAELAPVQLGAALPVEGDFIAIVQKSIGIAESGRSGEIVVSRYGDTTGVSSVSYRFVSESANANDDYRGVDGTLNWTDGESGERSIGFLVESDLLAEGDETFRMELFDAQGMHTLGINDSVTVSITDSPCTAKLPATISANMTLSAPCYQLTGLSTVGPAAQLSISPGTTIIASDKSGITFTGSSTLNSEGSFALPVTIKGETDKPGAWSGVSLQSTSALHRISNTEIANANNAVNVRSGGLALFNNNVFRNNAGAGIVLPIVDVETLQTQNSFINTSRGIELVGSNIEQGQKITLPAQSTHYLLSNGLIINGTLELEAGTDLRMAADVAVLVLSNGVVSALGTVDKPINISGLEPRQGYWNGIQYVSALSTDNRFEYVTIADGGGDPARAGNIIVDGLDTTIAMQNCALIRSAGYGIVYDSLSYHVELTATSFKENRLGEQSM